MPSTHLCINIHAIFSTKNREPLIANAWRSRMHAYIGGALKQMDVEPIIIGGIADHIHGAFRIRATHCLASVMMQSKTASSRWVHDEIRMKGFAWQDGYAAYSVSPDDLPALCDYIRNQEEHHRYKTFQEEYLEFLKKAGVEYDERYLW